MHHVCVFLVLYLVEWTFRLIYVTSQAHLPSVTDLCVHAAENLLPLRQDQVCNMCTGPAHLAACDVMHALP